MKHNFEGMHNIDWALCSEDKALQNLKASLDNPAVGGKVLPSFPPAELQLKINGTSGYDALLEACPFFRRILGYASELGQEIGADTRVLDFGCGWGRHLRFFWEIVNPENLYGVDIDPSFIELCRHHFSSGNFINNSKEPPMPLPDSSIDIAWSYSVFSHLNEEYNLKWMKDIHRVLKPNGLFIFTTQGRDFINFCASFRNQEVYEHEWFKRLGGIFRSDEEVNEAKRNFELGKFQYFNTGGGGGPREASFYGEALVPKKYLVDNWSGYFKVVDYFDPRSQSQQAVVVVQK